MALTPFGIKNAQARDKAYKLSDGGGLYLLVQPNGSKLWRMKYHFVGKERLLSFGAFPSVGLADARARRDEAKRLVAAGTDPSVQKKLDRIAVETASKNTFGLIAAEYLANMTANGAASATIEKNRWLLEDLAAPIANRPIAEITPAELLDLLKRVEKSGRRESARRLRGVVRSVFRLAVVTLRANSDPTFALRGALLRPKVQHRASIIEVTQLGALLRATYDYDGWPTITAALKFLALTMGRPGEVRGMRRSEVHFEKALWRIPAERTKMRRPHDVPLSRQAIEVLRDIWPMSDDAELVFPSIRSNRRPLSENALNSALRRMGFTKDEMTAHGFRSTASTLLNERGFAPDVIEAALGHQDENAIRRAYNRATYWPECPDKVGGLACFAGGSEDSAVVFLQQRDPIVDIRSMAKLAVNAEMSAEESRSQLGYQFFRRVCLRAEAIFETAIESRLVSAPMSQLMQFRRVIAFAVDEG